ncbi:PREDICTED: bicaudal D-related protein homolog [Nicrophorus vespilloides]|uniref:Bicaudal D-related protein homolog n=1 Tax=Nicrophorus vespilloides TaxID=110193 RepID=A0ABM1MAQ9_NICVS|nr:PREDICTED: bicaudal D-related protein homolog [Nicrophorus vespilloides]
MRELEDYIVEMENRNLEMGQSSEDLLTQLRLKENDLQLAAELGKALLEENETLKKRQDSIVEEYTKKLEFCVRLAPRHFPANEYEHGN